MLICQLNSCANFSVFFLVKWTNYKESSRPVDKQAVIKAFAIRIYMLHWIRMITFRFLCISWLPGSNAQSKHENTFAFPPTLANHKLSRVEILSPETPTFWDSLQLSLKIVHHSSKKKKKLFNFGGMETMTELLSSYHNYRLVCNLC